MDKKFDVTVIENREVAPQIFRMLFESAEIAAAMPGQFINIKCRQSTDPLLRRPFSVNNVEGDIVTILYQLKGKGTKIISEYEEGDKIDIIGSLGNGFTLPEEKSNVLLIAGGIGIAPMFFLARTLKKSGHTLTLLFGCMTNDFVPLIDGFSDYCEQVEVSTNDGSAGIKGFVTDIDIDYSRFNKVYACGPVQMLEAVHIKAAESGVGCEVSLESHMACGLGACLSCVCELENSQSGAGRYSRVCVDGPVYDSKVVKW